MKKKVVSFLKKPLVHIPLILIVFFTLVYYAGQVDQKAYDERHQYDNVAKE